LLQKNVFLKLHPGKVKPIPGEEIFKKIRKRLPE
jgi:hypothetical protein